MTALKLNKKTIYYYYNYYNSLLFHPTTDFRLFIPTSFPTEFCLNETNQYMDEIINIIDSNNLSYSFLPINFSLVEKAYFQQKRPALMTVLKNKGNWDKSNAYFKNKCVKYNKKKPQKNMDYIDYGLNVVKSSIFYNFPPNKTFDLGDVFESLSNKSLLAGLEIYDRFYEIGSINGLNDTMEFFKKLKNKQL